MNDYNSDTDKRLTAEEVAMGFIHVANEAMCRPIRALTQVSIMNELLFHGVNLLYLLHSLVIKIWTTISCS